MAHETDWIKRLLISQRSAQPVHFARFTTVRVERSALQTAPHICGCTCKTEWRHQSDRFKRKLGAINECRQCSYCKGNAVSKKLQWNVQAIHISNTENLLWKYVMLLKSLKQFSQRKAQVLVWKNQKRTCTAERPFAWLRTKHRMKRLSLTNEVRGRMPLFNDSMPCKFSCWIATIETTQANNAPQCNTAPCKSFPGNHSCLPQSTVKRLSTSTQVRLTVLCVHRTMFHLTTVKVTPQHWGGMLKGHQRKPLRQANISWGKHF